MGSWGHGPFDNDSALDFAGKVVGVLRKTIDGFVQRPNEDGFDSALAAVALLNRTTAAGDVLSPYSREEARERRGALLSFYKTHVAADADDGPFGDTRTLSVGRELERFVRESLDTKTVLGPAPKSMKADAKKPRASKAR